jgi:hypothetical protein
MDVGKVMITNRGENVDGKEFWHFHTRFKTASSYSRLYELDDSIDTYVTTENFFSLK